MTPEPKSSETPREKIAKAKSDIRQAALKNPLTWRSRMKGKRNRPEDRAVMAHEFMGIMMNTMQNEGVMLTTKNITTHARITYKHFCRYAGLKGKEKESIWRIVSAQIQQMKA